jgi:hypothetical protein
MFRPDRPVVMTSNIPLQVPSYGSYVNVKSRQEILTEETIIRVIALLVYIYLICDTHQASADLKTYIITL